MASWSFEQSHPSGTHALQVPTVKADPSIKINPSLSCFSQKRNHSNVNKNQRAGCSLLRAIPPCRESRWSSSQHTSFLATTQHSDTSFLRHVPLLSTLSGNRKSKRTKALAILEMTGHTLNLFPIYLYQKSSSPGAGVMPASPFTTFSSWESWP